MSIIILDSDWGNIPTSDIHCLINSATDLRTHFMVSQFIMISKLVTTRILILQWYITTEDCQGNIM